MKSTLSGVASMVAPALIGTLLAAAPPDDRRSVTALGRLEPAGRVVDIGAPSEERILEHLVAEGAWVEAGAPLFHVESYRVRATERDLARARYDAAVRRLETEKTVSEASIGEGEIELRARRQLDPLEIEAQAARVRTFELRLDSARREVARLEQLSGSVSVKEMQEKQLELETADQAQKTAAADLAALTLSSEIALLRVAAKLERYRAEFARVEAIHSVDPFRQQVALAEMELERTIIRAPAAGEVLKLFVLAGERAGDGPVMQIGNVREMYAVAEVYETDVRFVRPEQAATIRSPALPQPVRGTVTEVGRLIYKNDVLDVDPAADIDSRVVEVRIRLENDELVSRLTNLQVDVEILLRE